MDLFLFTLFWARDELPLFSRNFSFYFSIHFFTTSVEKEVSALLAESAGDCGVSPEKTVDRALQEVERLVEASGQSLYDVCTEAEAASDKAVLREILRYSDRSCAAGGGS